MTDQNPKVKKRSALKKKARADGDVDNDDNDSDMDGFDLIDAAAAGTESAFVDDKNVELAQTILGQSTNKALKRTAKGIKKSTYLFALSLYPSLGGS